MPETLDHGGRLLAQGRYRRLAELIAAVPAGQPDFALARIFAIRLELEQGRFGAGSAAEAEPSPDDYATDAAALGLWQTFAGLFSGPALSSRVGPTLAALDAASPRDDLIGLVARDLAVRVRLVAIQVGELRLDELEPAARALGPMAEEYERRGRRDEAFACRSRQERAYRLSPSTLPLAVPLLERTIATAKRLDEPLYEGEARGALARIRLAAALDRDPASDQDPQWTEEFDRVAELLTAGRHIDGAAQAGWLRAGVLLRYGRPAAASACADAFTRAGLDHLAAEVWSAVLVEESRRGNAALARHALERAQDVAPADGSGLRAVVEAVTAGDAALRDGRLGPARVLLNAALVDAPHRNARISLRVVLASTLGAAGLLADARVLLREALADRSDLGLTSAIPEALALLASYQLAEDSPAGLELLDQAVDAARRLGSAVDEGRFLSQAMWQRGHARLAEGLSPVDSVGAAWHRRALEVLGASATLESRQALSSAYQLRGQLAFLAKDWATCSDAYTAAHETATQASLGIDLAFTLQYQAAVLIEVGRQTDSSAYDIAIECLRTAAELFRTAEFNGMVWRAEWLAGVCDQEFARRITDEGAAGARRQRALRQFEAAAEALDLLRGAADHGHGVDRQQNAMAFTVDKQQAYRSGLKLAVEDLHDPVLALSWLERMKGVALLDALAGLAVPPPEPAAQPLLNAERDLHARKAQATSFDELAELAHLIDGVLAELARLPSAQGYATLRRTTAPQWPEVRQILHAEDGRLGGGRQLVVAEYFHEGPATIVLGLRSDWSAPRMVPILLDAQALGEFAAATFRQPGAAARQLRTRYGQAGWSAFAPLVAPLAEWSQPDDLVYLIPYGTLHDLPLHALPVAGTALAERNPICYAPSLAVLCHVLGRPGRQSHQPTGAAVFGNPGETLPRAQAEAREVAQLLDAGPPYLGAEVTRERVLTALAMRAIVHIASHAQASAADGFEAAIELAAGDRLQAKELLTATVRSGLIVLSGCETGVSEHRPGDELVGLIRALLHAGAGTLLTSQWQVDDFTAARLLTAFHRHRIETAGGLSRADALREAMRSVRATRKTIYHWAGFVLIGDWL